MAKIYQIGGIGDHWNTNVPMLQHFEEECNTAPYYKLRDEVFTDIIEAYGIDEDTAMMQMMDDERFIRLSDGWILQED